MGASQHETAEPFRKNAHGAANAGLDGENALDAGLALDFEGQRRDGMAFFRHPNLLRGRPALARSWVGGLRLLDGGSHTAAVVTRESLTADEMSGLKPTCSVFGDFLEIYSKGYAATVSVAVGYLTRRQSGQPLSFRVADFSVRRLKKEPRKLETSRLSGAARQSHGEHRTLAGSLVISLSRSGRSRKQRGISPLRCS